MICATVSSKRCARPDRLDCDGDARTDAMHAFRCRELLSIVLGMKPSAETDRLYRDIAAGESSNR